MPILACTLDAAVSSPSAYPFLPLSDASLPSPTAAGSNNWSPSLSAALYKIDGWGFPYFTVNSSGNISIRPHGNPTLRHQEIDLLKIVKKVSDPKSENGLGLNLPVIVRLPEVLKNRLESLQSAFSRAIKSQFYESHYQGVYPVKCNQDRFVVEDIVRFGSEFRFGLEAGSKPELLLAMSCLCKGNPEAFIICNGFKDAEYIKLAVLARKLKLNSVIVLEQEEELDLVIKISKRVGVKPVIGIRVKLRTKHSGHFGSTSGEKGKFGLNVTQILRVVRKLELMGMLDCLQLLHFHIGSQIPSTGLLADGVSEAAQLYCELVRLGADMRVIDIGGGLGIDYDGSKSENSDISVGYGLEEYALAVVKAVKLVCDKRNIKHPILCSESGRAIVSHHSILVFEAMSASVSNGSAISGYDLGYMLDGLSEDARVDYQNLTAAALRGESESCVFYSAQLKHRFAEQFKEGRIGMEQLAAVDGLCELVCEAVDISKPISTYNVNLSVFTSIPDFWGIGHLFPILPIHRLDQKPENRGVLSDLTCDSDGKIDKFIGGESSLPLHEISKDGIGNGDKYFLGMFLGGAYQEALGGFHNLFGGPSVVSVSQSDGPQGFTVTRVMRGASCSDVLRVMQHEPERMFETLKQRVEEFCIDDFDSKNGITRSLGCSFLNMPYLVRASSLHSLTPVDNDRFSNDNESNPGIDDVNKWSHHYARGSQWCLQ